MATIAREQSSKVLARIHADAERLRQQASESDKIALGGVADKIQAGVRDARIVLQ